MAERKQRPILDRTGHRFGRLVIDSLIERRPDRDHIWLCRCDCGNEKAVKTKLLTSGRTKSCGCAFSEMLAARNTTHGLSQANPIEYRTWKDMRGRCNRSSGSDFQDYGGRGITVCARWDDFALFLADMGKRPSNATLDRIDVNKGYGPDNCRWADATTQANNKRSNRRLTIQGESKTLAEWCNVYDTGHSKVAYRISHGWDLLAALTEPRYSKRKKLDVNGDNSTTA